MAARELRIAARKGDCGKLRELLDGGAGASVVNERTKVMVKETGKKFETTALIEAVASDQNAAVELLLEHSANPNLAASYGATPLMEAAATAGRLRILQTLLDRKDIAIDAVNPETGFTAFHYACFYGHADCAVELARRGCDMTLRTKDGETGKDIAEREQHTAVLAGLRALVVEQLCAKRQPSDALNDQQQAESLPVMTAVHELRLAVENGDCGKLRELLHGGGASIVDEKTEVVDTGTGEKVQTTALYQAVGFNQHAAVELLLEYRASPNLADSTGITPLMEAACRGHFRILRTLLDRKAIAIDAVGTKYSVTAFHLACIKGNTDCAVELARRGCDTTLRTERGLTGQQIAQGKKHTAVLAGLRALVVEQLQAKQQAKQQATSPPKNLLTTKAAAHELRTAAQTGDCGKLHELLDGGGASAALNERTEIIDSEGTGKKDWTTALVEAVHHGQHAAVELLLEHGANPNLPTGLGFTPLMIAAGRGHRPILRTLLDRKDIAIDAADKETGCTAFHGACFQDQADCAVELARRGCDMTLRVKKYGSTGKDMAERMKHTAVLEGLRALVVEQLQAKRQPNDSSDDQQQGEPLPVAGTTSARIAAQTGDCGKLRELLDGGGASVVNERTEITGEKTGQKIQTTALIQAMEEGDCGKLRDLLTERQAARSADLESCETELDLRKKKDMKEAKKAAAQQQLSSQTEVTEVEPEVQLEAELRLAALALRAFAGNGDCGKLRELLDGYGASVVDERTEFIELTGQKVKTTALIAAVCFGHHDAVDLLLEHGADPNIPSSDGWTPLKMAARGHLRILHTLLKHKDIAIDAVDAEFTAFHCACREGNADCAVELVRHGCNTKLHGVLTERCKLVQKLAVRKAQQQPIDDAVSSAAAAGRVPQADETAEQQRKVVKKAAANRKKKDRKKAKKVAEQQLVSQPEPQPEPEQSHAQLQPELEPQAQGEPEPAAEPEPEAEAHATPELQSEPELDEHTQQLQALSELGVQQWSATQVLEWVALADLPPQSVSVVIAVMELLGLDGEELLELGLKILQKQLAKHGAQDAEALAKQVIEHRDALLLSGDSSTESASPKSELSDILECPLCMELYSDDEAGLRVPRILTSCGHTVCHGCIANMLTRVLAEGNAKPYKCPTCSKVTKVAKGKAGSLPKNFALAAAAEAQLTTL
jgi:ankyrin repeat protein